MDRFSGNEFVFDNGSTNHVGVPIGACIETISIYHYLYMLEVECFGRVGANPATKFSVLDQ